MEPLAERYHELMSHRTEGLRKYRTTLDRLRQGPPTRLIFPQPRLGTSSPYTKLQLGPLAVDDFSPVLRIVDSWMATNRKPLRVLEIGPGTGPLAEHIFRRYAGRIDSYEGIERDPHVAGPYRRIDTVADAGAGVDLLLAIEVVEHLTAQELYDTFLVPVREKLAPGASFILSTPNALSPAGIARDFTHVQNYPWYDLYALLRLEFERVDVYRTYYPHLPLKWALLPLRQLSCAALGLDWCDGLVAIASTPRTCPSSPAREKAAGAEVRTS